MNGLQNMFKGQFPMNLGGINLNQIMSMLNPEQKQLAMELKEQNEEQRAEFIANWCNKNGIGKEQLENLLKGIIK